MDYEKQRSSMVKYQLKVRGIKDERVLSAIESVPRHLFVDESLMDRAYEDGALSIGEGQTISQPYMVAVMTELLGLKGGERVLEIGTGSGYQSAVLSLLCSEVFTVERIGPLASAVQERFRKLGYSNIHVEVCDGTLGLPEQAPFDAIIVTAAAPDIPDTYINQLKMNGRLVIPVGGRNSQQLYQVTKTVSGICTSKSTLCVFVPLIGKYGWTDS